MIYKAELEQLSIVAELACKLWPDHIVEERCAEFSDLFGEPDHLLY